MLSTITRLTSEFAERIDLDGTQDERIAQARHAILPVHLLVVLRSEHGGEVVQTGIMRERNLVPTVGRGRPAHDRPDDLGVAAVPGADAVAKRAPVREVVVLAAGPERKQVQHRHGVGARRARLRADPRLQLVA